MRWLCALGVVAAFFSCRTAGFKQVFTALDEQGHSKRTTVYADTGEIFWVGELASGREDVTVSTVIRANTLYDPATDSMVQARGVFWYGEAAPGKTDDTFVSFKLERVPATNVGSSENPPYPIGTFTCEMSIDGHVEDTVDFSIVFPACPKLPPTSGQPCAGWVHLGSECSSGTGLVCTCDGDRTWHCTG